MTKPFKSWGGDKRPPVPSTAAAPAPDHPPTVAESLAKIDAGLEQARAADSVDQAANEGRGGYTGLSGKEAAPASTDAAQEPAVTAEEERAWQDREEKAADDAGAYLDAPIIATHENSTFGLFQSGRDDIAARNQLEEVLRRSPGEAGKAIARRMGLLPPEEPEQPARDFESHRMQIEASAVPFVSGWCQTINGAARWTVIEEKAAQAIRKIAIAYANACRDGGDTPAKVNASIEAMLADMDAATKAALAGRKP